MIGRGDQGSPAVAITAGFPALTAAEVRIARERLGMTADQVAARLGVALRTVRRWESGDREVPGSVAAEYGRWVDYQDQQAAEWVSALLDVSEPVLVVPRVGDRDGWPAGWWRALAGMVVAEVPSLRVVYG